MITFVLPLPPTTNHTYATGGGRFYKNERGRAWESEAQYYLKKSRVNLIKGTVRVGIIWILKRTRDIDGGIKIILDALQTNRIIENDDLIYELHIKKQLDPKQKVARVVINIDPIQKNEVIDNLPTLDV